MLIFLLAASLDLFAASAHAWNPEVFKLQPYDSYQASALGIKSLHHDVRLAGKTVFVRSTWLFDENQGLAGIESIQFQSLYASGVNIDAIEANGSAVSWEFSKAASNNLTVPIHASDKLHSVSIQYRLENFEINGLAQLMSFEFFRAIPLVIGSDRKIGFDARHLSVTDYGEKILTSATISGPSKTLVFGSNIAKLRGAQTEIAPIVAGQFALGFADAAIFDETSFQSRGTRFTVFAKRGHRGLNPDFVERIVRISWPKYLAKFPRPTRWVVMYEDDQQPIGAGVSGTNIFGFGYQERVPTKYQEFLKKEAGWPGMSASRDYFNWIYRSSQRPLDDYWITFINHELGHLFFGFGLTYERHPFLWDYWQSLGLGCLVDNQITFEMTGHWPALFENFISRWRDRFVDRAEIDQRLQKPDTSRDQINGVSVFARHQFYAHAKSLYFWRQVQNHIGPRAFDKMLRDYVRSGGSHDGYAGFRETLLKYDANLPALEDELIVR